MPQTGDTVFSCVGNFKNSQLNYKRLNEYDKVFYYLQGLNYYPQRIFKKIETKVKDLFVFLTVNCLFNPFIRHKPDDGNCNIKSSSDPAIDECSGNT